MDSYYDLKKMLCRELDDLVKKGELSAGDLDVVDKLTHSIKSLATIMAMEDSGYSNDGGYDGYNSGNGGSYNSYNRNYSGARRRDSMGRYSGRRYSRDEAQSEMVREFERLMEDAPSAEVRDVIQRAVNQLKNM